MASRHLRGPAPVRLTVSPNVPMFFPPFKGPFTHPRHWIITIRQNTRGSVPRSRGREMRTIPPLPHLSQFECRRRTPPTPSVPPSTVIPLSPLPCPSGAAAAGRRGVGHHRPRRGLRAPPPRVPRSPLLTRHRRTLTQKGSGMAGFGGPEQASIEGKPRGSLPPFPPCVRAVAPMPPLPPQMGGGRTSPRPLLWAWVPSPPSPQELITHGRAIGYTVGCLVTCTFAFLFLPRGGAQGTAPFQPIGRQHTGHVGPPPSAGCLGWVPPPLSFHLPPSFASTHSIYAFVSDGPEASPSSPPNLTLFSLLRLALTAED